MLLLLFACVSPGVGSVRPADTETIPGVAPGDDVERLPEGDAREEDLPDHLVSFDHGTGLYGEPFQVVVTTELPDGEIYYTLDGTDPADGGEPYTGPIEVTTTTILRAAVVVGSVAVSRTRTATYLFPADIPDQVAPDDWPRQWWTDETGGPYDADYEMDPEVTDGDVWDAYATTLWTDIPILSVVMDPDALFDERRGIHENPLMSGDEWERAAAVELIDGEEGFAVDCGIRVHGASGREPENSPKKSFRLHFNDDYGGPKTLDFQVFPDSPRPTFETLVLRAGYNRSWAHFEHTGRKRADYARERFGHEVYRAMGYETPHVRHVHLFLDGVYWGLYQVEERPDADFMSYYVGGEPEDWDVLNMGEVMSGDDVAWLELMDLFTRDLADPDNYAAIEARVDLRRFADYVALQWTLGNVDWPDRNWYAARPRVDGGKWVFTTWDSELIMANTSEVVMYAEENDPGMMFYALVANEEFRVIFADAVARHHAAGGALSPEVTVPLFSEIAQAIVPGVIAESARWGDHWRDVRGAVDGELYTYEAHWVPEYTRLTGTFLPGRIPWVVAAFQAAGVYPVVSPPAATPGAGALASGDTVELDGAGADVWYTLDGTDPRAVGGAVAEGALRYTGPIQVTDDATVRARVKTDTEWSALTEATYTVD